MLLNEVGICVPLKIRQLLDKYNLGLLYLSEEKYEFLGKVWKATYRSYAIAMVGDNVIVINTDRIRRDQLNQAAINYILLHEIAHAGLNHLTEKKAHKCALGLARYYDIKVDGSPVALTE